MCVRGNSRKGDFLGKNTPYPKVFRGNFFWGLLPTKSLPTQDSENVVEVIKAQSEVIGQKQVVLQKIIGVTKN